MDFSNFKFRCHYQGDLVKVPKPLTTNQIETLTAYRERINGIGKPLTAKQDADWHSLENKLNESKIYTLSDSTKQKLSEIVSYTRYGRNYSLKNKYFDKGLLVEKEARDLISEVLGIRLTADDEQKSNDWVTGKRDVKSDILIIDNKACFELDTFNKHLTEKNDEYYFRQLDCYMELWGIKDSLLAYTLVDTPFKIVNDELRRLDYTSDVLDLNGDVRDERIETVVNLIERHLYTREALERYCNESSVVKIEWFPNFIEIPKKERVHFVSHSFDKVRIEQRNECLKLCREYMNTIKPMNNLTI